MDKTPVVLSFLLIGGVLLYLIAKKMEQKVALQAGENVVIYKGVDQTVNEAFASIAEYLVMVQFWNVDHWESVGGDTLMVPGGQYSIEVNQDCIWSF